MRECQEKVFVVCLSQRCSKSKARADGQRSGFNLKPQRFNLCICMSFLFQSLGDTMLSQSGSSSFQDSSDSETNPELPSNRSSVASMPESTDKRKKKGKHGKPTGVKDMRKKSLKPLTPETTCRLKFRVCDSAENDRWFLPKQQTGCVTHHCGHFAPCNGSHSGAHDQPGSTG